MVPNFKVQNSGVCRSQIGILVNQGVENQNLHGS
jgi:hypothetical protein